MATLKERIVQLLSQNEGLTDREITDRLINPGAPQQPVNSACRELEAQGGLFRKTRPDGKIGNWVTVTSAEEGNEVDEIRQSFPTDFLSEDAVKNHLKNWLESRGWRVGVAWQKERGIDIEAFKENQRWIIEVKGSGTELSSSRIVAQQGHFSVGTNILATHDDTILRSCSAAAVRQSGKVVYLKIVIASQLKLVILQQLRAMNVAPHGLFPTVDGLGRSLAVLATLRHWQAMIE